MKIKVKNESINLACCQYNIIFVIVCNLWIRY